jgi:hypothetical protein
MLPNCGVGHPKPGAFQHFSPTFQKLFLKRDFFDSFNGWRFRRLEGRDSLPKRPKTQSNEKGSFSVENPAVRVHALLAAILLREM